MVGGDDAAGTIKRSIAWVEEKTKRGTKSCLLLHLYPFALT